jgi:hypothetical protein
MTTGSDKSKEINNDVLGRGTRKKVQESKPNNESCPEEVCKEDGV